MEEMRRGERRRTDNGERRGGPPLMRQKLSDTYGILMGYSNLTPGKDERSVFPFSCAVEGGGRAGGVARWARGAVSGGQRTFIQKALAYLFGQLWPGTDGQWLPPELHRIRTEVAAAEEQGPEFEVSYRELSAGSQQNL